MFGKKGDGGLTAVVIIIIIIAFIAWLVKLGQRECNNDNECENDFYCGADFSCHKMSVIERTVSPTIVTKDYSGLAKSFLILALALIVSSIILKYNRNKGNKEQPENKLTIDKQIGKPMFSKQEMSKSKRNTSTYILLGAIAGAVIVCLLLLIIISLS
ncbi:MAG: hypothetical protein KKF65_00300 [Nanoarchaeota archaeon]|nr:hypothetical protein [Nanoarchaeota archaeon]